MTRERIAWHVEKEILFMSSQFHTHTIPFKRRREKNQKVNDFMVISIIRKHWMFTYREWFKATWDGIDIFCHCVLFTLFWIWFMVVNGELFVWHVALLSFQLMLGRDLTYRIRNKFTNPSLKPINVNKFKIRKVERRICKHHKRCVWLRIRKGRFWCLRKACRAFHTWLYRK